MAVLGLRFCVRAFSSCGKRGPLFITVCGPLTIVASLVAEHRLQTCRLSTCGSRAQPLCGMWDLPRPGPEPVSLCIRSTESYPLDHQGSPSGNSWTCLDTCELPILPIVSLDEGKTIHRLPVFQDTETKPEAKWYSNAPLLRPGLCGFSWWTLAHLIIAWFTVDL